MMFKKIGLVLPVLYAERFDPPPPLATGELPPDFFLPVNETLDDLPVADGFRTVWSDQVIDHSPDEFKGNKIIDHSGKLTRARYARVNNFDEGRIVASATSYYDSYYSASYCIDGRADHTHNIQAPCVARTRSTDNWFADITGDPTISYVKIHLCYYNQFKYSSWGYHYTYRTFVDDNECFPIEYYSDQKIASLFSSRQPMIFKCPNDVENASQVRVSAGHYGNSLPQYMFFSEVEIGMNNLPCKQEPCKNGGECLNTVDRNGVPSYQCNCPTHYLGDNCELEPECNRRPCQNNGECINKVNNDFGFPVPDFECNCRNGYGGDVCEHDPACNAGPCFNGRCENKLDSDGMPDFVCHCPPHYLGDRCEHEPICNDSPCLNGGSCVNTVGNDGLPDHKCNCLPHYQGENCEHEPACNKRPCLNSGVCVNTVGNDGMPDYECNCINHYLGDNCEVEPACLKKPCLNSGTCVNKVKNEGFLQIADYECNCHNGYLGDICEHEPACLKDPCFNNGYCVNTVGSDGMPAYRCNCRTGYVGDHCQFPSACNGNPCRNGGSCRNQFDFLGMPSAVCTCRNGYTGSRCEIAPRQPCDSRPCQNGGRCTNQRTSWYYPNGYRCDCYGGTHGRRCENQNPCRYTSCWNGGWCQVVRQNWWGSYPVRNTARCNCRSGFWGSRCQNRIWTWRRRFWGDVHYTTIDGQNYANQGWCSYILTTNGLQCNGTMPSSMPKTDANFYKTGDTSKDFFSVIVDQEPLDSDPTYQIPVSVLNGVDVIVRPRLAPDSLFKFSASKSFGSGYGVKLFKSEFDRDENDDLIWTDENPDARFIGKYNAIAQNVGVRVEGVGDSQVINIFIGCGQSGVEGAELWHTNNHINTYDCLMKISYTPATGSIGIETTDVMKKSGDTQLCGIAGDFDGQPDFDEDSFENALDKLDYEMDQEIANYYKADKKCKFISDDTVKAGIPIPMDAGTYFHAANRRKKRAADPTSCNGDIDTITAACEQINDERFSACGLNRTALIAGCIFDSCTAPSNAENFKCGMLAGFVADCNRADADLNYEIRSWRDNQLCPLTCGANQEFHGCAKPACFPTAQSCEVNAEECAASTDCVEGCFCKEGFLQDGNVCTDTCHETAIEEMTQHIAASSPCSNNPCRNDAVCSKNENDSTDYICTCTEGWTGKNCDELPAEEFSNTLELLEFLINGNSEHTRRKRTLVAEDVLQHGCYCTRLLTGKGLSGRPVSDYDQICKDMFVCSQCKASDCSREEMYPYKVKISEGDYVCDNTSDCKQSACECDLFHMNRLTQHERDTGDSLDADECDELPALGEFFECCGNDKTWKMYNTAVNRCENISGVNVIGPI